jgi:hypothetical protein
LLEESHHWVCWPLLSPSLLPAALAIDVLTIETIATIEEHARSWSSKKHSKDVVVVELILPKLLTVSLIEILLCSMFIIDLSLFWITKASICSTYLLEGVRGIRSSVLVWVKLDGKLFISLLNLIFARALLQAQNLIIILFSDNSLAFLNLYR